MLTAIQRRAAAFLMTAILAFSAQAQSGARELHVATRILPPLVADEHGKLTGFSIELWDKIAERLDVKTIYEVAPDIDHLLEEVRSRKAQVGISAISITSAREAEFDFSQPMLNGGLQIMVRGKVKDDLLEDLFNLLFSRALLVWLGIALLLILIPAHLVWLVERRHKNGIVPSESYIPGIFYALFWAAGTLATQADQMPRHWFARLVAVLWMFTAVVFVAFYTAQLTANLTIQKIQGSITGPDDLQGRRVATTVGSTSAAFLKEEGAQVFEFSQIDDGYHALLNKEVDAIVFDAPVLLNYAASKGKGNVHMVGTIFHKEDYGIVFQQGDPLRKQVNNALLILREDGTYQQIYEKWFVLHEAAPRFW